MKNRGFIKSIIIIVGALVALKYFFNFDIVDLLSEGRYGEVWAWLKVHIWEILGKIRMWFAKE